MDKYEISLWEDYPDTASDGITPFLNERKICVVGSNDMISAARALEPKLVSNVNGTHTFTFRIYYRYRDEITGEEKINPYLSYIINERKVKVLWKDKWYDLVIKKMEEDTQKRSVICTCEDLFITELSKNGYELEFNSELQNNSGTASELMEKVLEGSGWRPAAQQDTIIQYHEEPVYEVETQKIITVIKQSPSGNTSVSIPMGETCLLFQSCLDESCTNIQFLYSSNGYKTEENGLLVLNGDCYRFTGKVSYSGDQAIILNTSNVPVFQFTISDSYSSRFRANRLVNSQLTVFDDLLGRYVDVYTDNQGNRVYGYETTEYSDPTLVVNLIANSKDFKDTKGWIGNNIIWKVYPSFPDYVGSPIGLDKTVVDYNAKSYLKAPNGEIQNSGLSSNKQYLTPNSADIKDGKLGGFQVGEKYIFRYKAVATQIINKEEFPKEGNYIHNNIKFEIKRLNDKNQWDIYFTTNNKNSTIKNNWTEFELTCQKPCPANLIESLNIYITNTGSNVWIEDIQFFKLAYGKASYNDDVTTRMNPGEVALQSIANVVYRYYNPDHGGVEDPKDLVFLYQGKTKSNDYIPVYNNYEKITSIEESKSNRFNILQSIAEKFECWVRFIINHNENTGQVLYDSQGLPQKYVQLVEQIGKDTGISFEYGIDLKGVKRTIVSNTIATKAIIPPNSNEFAKNGFCTIARSQLNYCRENFILNFDYYIQQGLLNREAIEGDLYKTNNGYLGYYFYLNRLNKRYDAYAEEFNVKKLELTKQEAEYKVLTSNLRAAEEKETNAESDLMLLAGVDSFAEADEYVKAHADNRKVQSLMSTIGQLKVNINELRDKKTNLSDSITKLKDRVENLANAMDKLINYNGNDADEVIGSPNGGISLLHKKFFQKYSRFIQEGTWQDENYVSDDDYYLDGLEVAYRSSRPQIQYDISLLRLSGLEEFSSKTFDLGDICYVQDKEFFGYEDDGITPHKQRIIISELTSFFDTPEKDVIKVQNYSTQFDDLFHRITAATQALQFSQGKFERAAGVVNPDKTLSFGLLQDTFDYNKDLVLNSANQQVTWDNTGITVADETNSALKVKIMAGGIFASNDGGATWKNALRGDGISTDLLTAGRINTSEIYIYDGNKPTFRWDSYGINAYTTNEITDDKGKKVKYPYSKYVRFDQFGIYGYAGTEDFVPEDENAIWYKIEDNKYIPNDDVRFGLTWRGFFLHGSSGISGLEIVNEDDEITFRMTSNTSTTGGAEASLEISTDKDIVLKTQAKDKNGEFLVDPITDEPVMIDRIQIGRYNYKYEDDHGDEKDGTDYGIFVRDENGENVFNVSADGVDTIGGWNLTKNSFYHTVESTGTLGLFAEGKNWTILSPISSVNDLTKYGNPQTGTGEPDIGDTNDYYIIAGNKFGVTVDGEIYSAGGRIGGWFIDNNSLYNNNIYIDSNGNIRCAASSTIQQNKLPTAREGIIYVVVKNMSRAEDQANPKPADLDFDFVTTLENITKQELKNKAHITLSIGNLIPNSKNYYINCTGDDTVVINGEELNIKYITGILYVSSVQLTSLPEPEEGIIYIVADNKTKTQDGSTPQLTYQIVTTLQGKNNEIRTKASPTLTPDGDIIKCTVGSSQITIDDTSYRVVPVDGKLYTVSAIWNINSDGYAYFHNIEADGGYIAGWHIDDDKIWSDHGTFLSATQSAQYQGAGYSIVTPSLAAYGGKIGGWNLDSSSLRGGGVILNSNGELNLGETGKFKAGYVEIEKNQIKINNAIINAAATVGNINITSGLTISKDKYDNGGLLTVAGTITAKNGITITDSNGIHFMWGSSPNESRDYDLTYDDIKLLKELNLNHGIPDDTNIKYLDWLHTNWKHTTPADVGL